MNVFNMAFGAKKGTKNKFADFIRNAKSEEKKRVYSAVLVEASRQQNQVMSAAQPLQI
jgi:hypothetical protein